MTRKSCCVPILLILVCLWINFWRYPSIWVMLNGQYVPQLCSKPLIPVRNSDLIQARLNSVNQSKSKDSLKTLTDDPPKIVSENTKENQSSTKTSPYENVSQKNTNEEGGAVINLSENVFQNPTLSRPVRTEKTKKSEQDSQDKTSNPQETTPTNEKSEDNEDRFVSVMPSKDNLLSAQKKTVIPAVIYRAPGEPGTSPMNLEMPSYGP